MAARKTVTVVFSDIANSTPLGEALDPEVLRERDGAVLRASCAAELERHGGTVEKFIGDAVMAVFGIPTVHDDDALRAVRAAIDMRTALGGAQPGARGDPRRSARDPDGRQHGRGRRRGSDRPPVLRDRRRRRHDAATRGRSPLRRDPARRLDLPARLERGARRADGAARAQGQGRAGPRLAPARRRRGRAALPAKARHADGRARGRAGRAREPSWTRPTANGAAAWRRSSGRPESGSHASATSSSPPPAAARRRSSDAVSPTARESRTGRCAASCSRRRGASPRRGSRSSSKARRTRSGSPTGWPAPSARRRRTRRRGDVLGRPPLPRAHGARAADHPRDRRAPVGRADVPRPPRVPRRLDVGRAGPRPRPLTSRAARAPADLEHDQLARARVGTALGRRLGAPRRGARGRGRPRRAGPDPRRRRGQSALRRADARPRSRGRPARGDPALDPCAARRPPRPAGRRGARRPGAGGRDRARVHRRRGRVALWRRRRSRRSCSRSPAAT